MTPLFRKLLGMNWLIVIPLILLSVFGVLAIYGTSYSVAKEHAYWEKQMVWVMVGLVVFITTSVIHYRWVRWAATPMYIAGILLTALTYVIGEMHGNARCWLRIPGVGTFQPSQLALVASILTVALFLIRFERMHPFMKLMCVASIISGPMILTLKQPDVGMTIVWVPVMMSILLMSGLPKRYIILILLVGLFIFPLVVFFGLRPYARARLVAFMDPYTDPQDTGFAIIQSLTAVGSGGFDGKGFKAPGTLVEQGLIPRDVAHTDYIYSSIGEQWGFVGGVVLVAVFSILLLACLFSASRSADEYGLMIATGVTAQIGFHVYQNIGMTIGVMPITGLPLPLISYGGTFLLMVAFGLGLVNSVWVHRKEPC